MPEPSPWEDLADWWLRELENDAAYTDDVIPLLRQVFGAIDGRVLELGCGEGRVLRLVDDLGGKAIGVDINEGLARKAGETAAVVVGMLPFLSFLRDASVDGVVAVLVAEHLEELGVVFSESARVCRPGGTFSLVMNHPIYTAPGSAPIVDTLDGELLWRWGTYLTEAPTAELLGDRDVTFYHRPMASVLNDAASAGWILERVVEHAVVPESGPLAAVSGQEQFPRLFAARWSLKEPETPRTSPGPS